MRRRSTAEVTGLPPASAEMRLVGATGRIFQALQHEVGMTAKLDPSAILQAAAVLASSLNDERTEAPR